MCAAQELSGQTKVCLRVDDEEGLMQLQQDARNAGGLCYTVPNLDIGYPLLSMSSLLELSAEWR